MREARPVAPRAANRKPKNSRTGRRGDGGDQTFKTIAPSAAERTPALQDYAHPRTRIEQDVVILFGVMLGVILPDQAKLAGE